MDIQKINVLLDLDNTIINSLESADIKQINSSFRSFKNPGEPSEFESHFHFADMAPFFRVYARPHLEAFLDYLFEHFNVGVWTAAESEYALFIIKHFIETKPERKVKVIFYRYHVDAAEKRYGNGKIKDLRLLWEHYHLFPFYPCNTILIDDLIDVKMTNPKNVFPIKSFDVMIDNEANEDAARDRELYNVMDTLETLRIKYHSQEQTMKRLFIRNRFVPILELLSSSN
jgi:hypothetical protein